MPSYLEWCSLSALLPFFSAVPGSDGHLDTDQFWGKLVKEHITQVAGARVIKNARMLQEKVVGMLLTLQTLARSLEEINATFKERTDCVARRQGLDSLPNETLEHILCSVTSVFTETLGLSHVCSRFRQVMLDSPHIWANCRLSTSMNSRQIGALVDRSQIFPLKVDIGCKDRCDNWSRRVDNLFFLKDRIEELEFQWLSRSEIDQVSRQYPELQMTNLRKLTMNSVTDDFEISDFYALWSLPNLKCLGLTNFFPTVPVFQQISYCRMRFTYNWNLHYLSAFLQTLSSLETLEIELDNLDSNEEEHYEEEDENYDGDDCFDDDSPWFSNVSSFSFSVIGKTLVLDARRILESIRLNVTEMSLTIVYPKYGRKDYEKIYWRQLNFLKLIRHFPMLEKLELHLSGPDADYHLHIGEILFLVPRTLQNLRIEAPGHILSMSHCDHTPPLLHTLQFRNCDRLNLQTLEDVHNNFLYDNVVVGKVEVTGCRLVEEEKLRDTFPNSEVVWKT